MHCTLCNQYAIMPLIALRCAKCDIVSPRCHKYTYNMCQKCRFCIGIGKKFGKNLAVSQKSRTFAPEKIKYWDMV